ncbi:MAG: ATP-binding protein [Thermodesulfobacteriota bacterium]
MPNKSTPQKHLLIPSVLLVIVLIYMAVSLGINYQSRTNLHQAYLSQWKQECKNTARHISYFLTERKQETAAIANSQDINNFFINQSLGMSMRYGLGLTLENIDEYLKKYTGQKTFDKQKIFTRMILLLEKEKILIDTAGKQKISPLKDSGWDNFYAPEKKEPHIAIHKKEGQTSVLISAPCFFEKKYRGQLLAWMNIELIEKLFLDTENTLEEGKLITSGREYIAYSQNLLPESLPRQEKLIFSGKEPHIIEKVDFWKNGNVQTLLSISCPISQTNWRLLWLKPRSLFSGHIHPWSIPAILAAFSFIVLAAILFLFRTGNKNILLTTRLEEGKKREREIKAKNALLQEEIEKRRQIAEELHKHRKYLHELVETRTHDLNERIKEMNLLVRISELAEDSSNSLEYILNQSAELIPGAWQYPELATAKITVKNHVYTSKNYQEPHKVCQQDIIVHGKKQGNIKVGYIKSADQNPPAFLNEEDELLHLITERIEKIIEYHDTVKKLREANNETGLLLSSISSVLISLDAEFKIFRWNQAAEQFSGISADNAAGNNLLDLNINWDKDKIEKSLLKCSKKLQRTEIMEDISFTRPQGGMGILGLTIHPIIESKQLCGFVLLGADITEKRAMQSQLAQAQKMKSLGQLAAGIAHEINTPTQYVGDNLHFLQDAFASLTEFIKAHAQFLRRMEKNNVKNKIVEEIHAREKEIDFDFLVEEIPKALEQSRDGIKRITRIVRSMKEFSHPGERENSLIDINKALENTITVSKNEWKYDSELQTDFDPNLPHVYGLSSELNQVFLNIIVNAAQAIREMREQNDLKNKGKINIQTRTEDKAAVITISDTGPGMPEEIRERVFEPFFTTKDVGKGTGQGMYLSHQIIADRLGGEIFVESEPGKGSIFTIKLPISDIMDK